MWGRGMLPNLGVTVLNITSTHKNYPIPIFLVSMSGLEIRYLSYLVYMTINIFLFLYVPSYVSWPIFIALPLSLFDIE